MDEQIPKVLIVDDEEATIRALKLCISMGDLELDIASAHNSADAFAAIAANQYDIVVADYQLKEKFNGVDVVKKALEKDPSIKTVLLSGNLSHIKESVDFLSRVILKPVGPDDLEAIIKELIHEKQKR